MSLIPPLPDNDSQGRGFYGFDDWGWLRLRVHSLAGDMPAHEADEHHADAEIILVYPPINNLVNSNKRAAAASGNFMLASVMPIPNPAFTHRALQK
jgi:hypothetical protein